MGWGSDGKFERYTHTISKVSEALELGGPSLNTADGEGGMLSVATVEVGRIELFVVGID